MTHLAQIVGEKSSPNFTTAGSSFPQKSQRGSGLVESAMSAKDTFCPLLKKACIESRCKWWIHIRGKHPQSESEIDMPDCAIKWLPVLLIENAQMERQTGAAVESFRNESVKTSRAIASGLKAVAGEAKRVRLIRGSAG